MMRSLWTGATGMKSQQMAVDTIANNLSNVNTLGFKQKSAEFKTLLYQTLQVETTYTDGTIKPTPAQVGLGARVAATNTSFATGIQEASDNPASFYIAGNGFFSVQGVDGNTYYTRDGDFNWSIDADGARILTTNDGLRVLDSQGQRIVLPDGVGAESVSVDTDGVFGYIDADGNGQTLGVQIGIYQFANRNGLESRGDNLYAETDASGAAINEAATNLNLTRSKVLQGYIEGSNVSMADQMTDLIIAQRAYQMNSKAITTSDSMLDTANNLRR